MTFSKQKKTKGYLCLMLHAHLPFVRHPEHEFFMEENWLYEAITETYIPLIDIFENLIKDKIDFRITMSLTPPLMNMLADPLLQKRYVRHITRLIELSKNEIKRTKNNPALNKTAIYYKKEFEKSFDIFVNKYKKNILRAFKKFQDLGVLEVVTCGATHGFLPLIGMNRDTVEAQISVAAKSYQRHMGKRPRGIWLGECGYNPGDDKVLKKHGINFFFVDSHGILHSNPRPKYGIFSPVFCDSGVAAFARDVESSESVWSAVVGYPGDYNYREFYRDIGFDLDIDYIKKYTHPDGIRQNTGIKYYKITGKKVELSEKEPYDYEKALERVTAHAADFVEKRQIQINRLCELMGDRPPLVVSPYDAELFGHWWYEGPHFIDGVIRKLAEGNNSFKMITPSEFLKIQPVNQVVQPSYSSWGANGYCDVWLDKTNDWIYPHLHVMADRMSFLARKFENASGTLEWALNQAARELLLAQSSDWAFIIKTGTTVEYATRMTKQFINSFNKLYEDILNDEIDLKWLRELANKDNIFPEVDFRVYINN